MRAADEKLIINELGVNIDKCIMLHAPPLIIPCRLSENSTGELYAADQKQLDYLWEASSVLAS